jgi:hypothetical protein
MKGSVRLTVLIALAALFAFGLFLPDISPPPGGQALAQAAPTPDFTLGTTKVEVTYETAECVNGGILSVVSGFFDSDSYEVNANVDATGGVDLDTDVTQNGLSLLFFDAPCAELAEGALTPQNGPIDSGQLISWQVIPGNAIHKTSNKNWTIYSFEGNVPRYSHLGTLFDHLEMNLKINQKNLTKSSLHVEANTSFSDWNAVFFDSGEPTPYVSPVSMVFDIGQLTGTAPDWTEDTDYACVDVWPQYSTRDVSSSLCGTGEEFVP